jgi:hypothetical protein
MHPIKKFTLNDLNTRSTYMMAVLFVCGLVYACGSDSQANDSQASMAKAEVWNGTADGYVGPGVHTNDRIELFIRLGRVLAAVYAYNGRADQFRRERNQNAEQIAAAHARVAALLNKDILASYADIHPLIAQKMSKTRQPSSLQSMLVRLTQDQQISDIINGDRTQRDRQQIAKRNALDTLSRIPSVVIEFFPSRHEYLLASSALIREAGDKVAIAVSADGVVLDTDLLQEASALMDRSLKLNPRNVSYCDAQRLPMRAHKDALNTLLDKMVPIELGITLSVTAGDVYSLAKQAQLAGERFPVTDSSKCD